MHKAVPIGAALCCRRNEMITYMLKAVPIGAALCCRRNEMITYMLKACSTCGKLHNYNEQCPKRIEFSSRLRKSNADKFRNTSMWRKKRTEIMQRDCNICRVCYTEHKITTTNLSVHHIISLEKNFELKLCNDNLITLCRFHHEQAEKGEIQPNYLFSLLKKTITI
jgi:5-methylcytosine-specific restriction endonuclease McrA